MMTKGAFAAKMLADPKSWQCGFWEILGYSLFDDYEDDQVPQNYQSSFVAVIEHFGEIYRIGNAKELEQELMQHAANVNGDIQWDDALILALDYFASYDCFAKA
jgi:hypothetical protein